MTSQALATLLLAWSLGPGAPGWLHARADQSPSAATDTHVITGVVHDASGSVVAGASVVARGASGAERPAVSAADGSFSVTVNSSEDMLLIVRAPGFSEVRQTVRATSEQPRVEVVLTPATLSETVTVTAVRGEQRIGDVPASITIVDSDSVRQSAAIVADDVLRQVPTFSLFRRTSSLASHPTTQGVSLRGIGPSGVSRTLVLFDDIPFNDPFGGWVYWTRVPLENAERVEVVDGPSSSLYGNYAMGGVINIVSPPATRRQLDVRAQYGTHNTPKLDTTFADLWGRLGVVATVSALNTDGFPIVAEAERGRVDNNAAVEYGNGRVKLDYQASDRVRAFFRGGYFHENRDNGKASTIDGTEEANRTRWTSVSGGVRMSLPDQSELRASVFTDVENFRSNFLAVPPSTPPRNLGRMTLNQEVPVNAVGATALYSRAFGQHYVSAGTDWRWVDGDSNEDVLDPVTGTRVTLHRISGGTQRILGAYVQDLFQPMSRLTLTLSDRLDHWNNYDGHNLETAVVNGVPTNNIPSLPSRSDTVNSPRVAALYRINDTISVWSGVGWGFRAPTLNELYRQFRVGTTLTLANNELGPERLFGYEGGTTVTPGKYLTVRATLFANRLKDPVSNVTIATAGAAVTQQRQNLGQTRVRGIQTDAEYRIGGAWKVMGAYVFNRATVTENPNDPDLVGNYLPQVPKHRGSARLAYSDPAQGTVAVGVLFVGAQYDDDRNTISRRLPGYAVVDLALARNLQRNVELFFSVQNLLDKEYLVGTLPTTIGTPRLISGGVRLRFN
jgi:outer membrane receptor protein involved in Fe transport